MTFHFKPAVRENVNLLIGLIGASGSGKTYSAMRLAKGICGDKPFAVIDTEAGRAKHYADKFRFDHGDLLPPFSPDAYAEAIAMAAKAGYQAVIVDSMSHEHAGEGGLLDWQEQELTRMAGADYHRREACKIAAWVKPKTAHKQMVQRLLQVRTHLILCFRAEEKVKIVKQHDEKSGKEKTAIVPAGWQPICEKNLPYELTCSFLLTGDKPGIPQPLKLQEQHLHLFPTGKPITEASGSMLAEWAAGGAETKQGPSVPHKFEGAVSEKEMTKAQKQAIMAAANKAFNGMAADEVATVVDWFCSRNGGKTFVNGERLAVDFATIAAEYMDSIKIDADAEVPG